MTTYKNLIKTTITLTVIGLFLQVKSVSAVTLPSFPSCINPQGTLQASYSDGVHGIVGDSKTYTGSDSVYKLTDNTLTQCFCDKNGNGIQTNWMKTTGLSEQDINSLKNDGWVLIPNGADWGLSNEPYLAKNQSYSCLGGIGGAGGTGGSGNTAGASAQNQIGEALGLASTGNIASVYFYFVCGVLLLMLGLNLKLVSDRK